MTSKKLWKKYAALLALTLAIILGTYGAIPPKVTNYKKVGNYMIGTYSKGIFISQAKNPIFYNIDLFKSHITYENGVKIAVPFEITEIEEYKANTRFHLLAIYNNALTYLNLLNLKATTTTKSNEKIRYSVAIRDTNKVNVSITGLDKNVQTLENIISFNVDDIIFDEKGNLYTELDNIKIEEVNRYLLRNRVPTEIRQKAEKYNDLNYFNINSLYILNPKLRGAVKVVNSTFSVTSEINIPSKYIVIQTSGDKKTMELEFLNFEKGNQ